MLATAGSDLPPLKQGFTAQVVTAITVGLLDASCEARLRNSPGTMRWTLGMVYLGAEVVLEKTVTFGHLIQRHQGLQQRLHVFQRDRVGAITHGFGWIRVSFH
jgi:hypothetical protein